MQEQQKDIEIELHRYKAIEAVMNQEGGVFIISDLKRNIASDVETIISLFKGSETEIRCSIAKLIADLRLYRALIHAPEGVSMLEEELSKLLETDKN